MNKEVHKEHLDQLELLEPCVGLRRRGTKEQGDSPRPQLGEVRP